MLGAVEDMGRSAPRRGDLVRGVGIGEEAAQIGRGIGPGTGAGRLIFR